MEDATVTVDDQTRLMRRDLERLKTDLQMLRDDISGLKDDTVTAARTKAAEVAQRLADQVKAAAAKSKEAMHEVERQVVRHPVISLGAVFAVGVLIGIGYSRKA